MFSRSFNVWHYYPCLQSLINGNMETGANSLTLGIYGGNFKSVIFEFALHINILGISCEIALIWIPQSIFEDKSTLIHVFDWCRQATWPSFLTPYFVNESNKVWTLTCVRNTRLSTFLFNLSSYIFLIHILDFRLNIHLMMMMMMMMMILFQGKLQRSMYTYMDVYAMRRRLMNCNIVIILTLFTQETNQYVRHLRTTLAMAF